MRFWRPSLPLLQKELIEQASHIRTFIIRVLMASVLVLTFGLTLWEKLGSTSPLGSMGIVSRAVGGDVLQTLAGFFMLGIYLFLPAMSCAAFTVEKERNTLQLLFLTKLSSGTLIFEKLLSRLVPILSLLLMLIQLVVFIYPLGGVSLDLILGTIILLTLSCLQVASCALCCSTYFRSTAGAFLGTYFTLGILYFAMPFVDTIFLHRSLGRFLDGTYGNIFDNSNGPDGITFLFFPILAFERLDNLSRGSAITYWGYLGACLPILASSFLFLAAARFFLFRRAFVNASNPLLRLFRFLDKLFFEANERYGKGIVLIGDRKSLPVTAPVTWRETTRRSLSQARYLIRILVCLELPILLFDVLLLGDSRDNNRIHMVPYAIAWFVGVLIVAVSSSTLVSGEHSRQTLDTLLTTPMTSRFILRQKLASLSRLIAVSAIPILTCTLVNTWWMWELDRLNHSSMGYNLYGYSNFSPNYVWWLYLLEGVTCMGIYLYMVGFLGTIVGTLIKSPSRAIVTTLAIVLGVCALPLLVISLWTGDFFGANYSNGWMRSPIRALIYRTSPLSALFNESMFFGMSTAEQSFLYVVNTIFYGAITWFLWTVLMNNSERLLGRRGWPVGWKAKIAHLFHSLNPFETKLAPLAKPEASSIMKST